MKSYIVYDEVGKILRTGSCPDYMLETQANAGEYVLEGRARDSIEMVVNGKLAMIPEAPSIPDAELMRICKSQMRETSICLLFSTDWTQVIDIPFAAGKREEWATYRQALRDMPETYDSATSLDDVTWPTKPQ